MLYHFIFDCLFIHMALILIIPNNVLLGLFCNFVRAKWQEHLVYANEGTKCVCFGKCFTAGELLVKPQATHL